MTEISWLRGIARRTIRNAVVRKELGKRQTLINMIRRRRLPWFDHAVRMNNRITTNGIILLQGGITESRKTSKDMDGKCMKRTWP